MGRKGIFKNGEGRRDRQERKAGEGGKEEGRGRKGRRERVERKEGEGRKEGGRVQEEGGRRRKGRR